MIFIDTGPFLGRYLARDQHHRAALEGWQRLRDSSARCFTSSFVLDEAITLLSRWAGPGFAAERARNILTSNRLTVLRPDAQDELAAVDLLEKLGDQGVSYTDCISFQLMRRRGLRQVFTFDRHFEVAGFEVWS